MPELPEVNSGLTADQAFQCFENENLVECRRHLSSYFTSFHLISWVKSENSEGLEMLC